MQETQEMLVQSLVPEGVLEEAHQPTPIFLTGGSHGQRSRADYSPWGHKESDTMEAHLPQPLSSMLVSVIEEQVAGD